ncbi:MAG TPA: peptidoglycan DD-metalloendopeptidase family protein, partial [Chitinophagaceae bacterium]
SDGQPAQAAAAPNLSLVTIDPSNTGGDVIFLTTAPISSKDVTEGLISILAEIKNNEAKTVFLDKIIIECKGGGNNISRTFQPDEDGKDTIKAGKSYEWQNSREYHELGNVIKIKTPFPNQVVLKFFFDDYPDPFTVTKNLKSYQNATAGNAYDFPAKDENLLMNEYWYGDAGHGGGGQVFAYDMVVAGWNEDAKKWDQMKQGKTEDKNENWRCYGKKIYSAGDGEVIGFINDWTEAPSTSDTGSAGGNSIKINNGKETVCYYHMQKGSINKDLQKIGAKVKKGQFIGLVGNSGNSSGPHLHIHAIWDPDKDGKGPFVPLQFSNMYAIDIKKIAEPDPSADWVKLNKMGLPYIAEAANGSGGRALLWPDAKKPCWYPYNLKEIARHGIPESKYQEEFTKIWGCGYYPVWVDAYDVSGKTYFNTIFRYNKDNYDVVVRHDMSAEKYQDEYNNWVKSKGYRLQQIDNYNDGGKLKIAAIFIKKPGGSQSQPAYHAASPDDHQTMFDKYSKEGYVPVNVSVTSVGGKKYYAAFYEKRNVGAAVLKSSLTQEEYQDMFDDMKKKKWEQVYINAYHHDGKTRFSVIWYEKSGYDAYGVTRKSSNSDYQEKWSDYLSDGYLTRCVSGYDEGGKHWFAAHWSK